MVRMFCEPTECCVHPRANRLVSALSGAAHEDEHLADVQELVLRRAADARHDLRRISVDVFLQEIDDAARVLPLVIDLGESLVVQFVVPRRLVVRSLLFVVACEEPVLEGETFLHDEAGVRIVPHVFVLQRVLFQQVTDHAVEKSDVRARPDRRVIVRNRGCTGEARINDDELSAVFDLRFDHPFEAARVGFGRIAAHHDHNIGVLDILPGVGHRATTECWGQTGHRRSVSDARLIVEDHHP